MQYLPQSQPTSGGIQYLQLIPTRPLIVPISPFMPPMATPQQEPQQQQQSSPLTYPPPQQLQQPQQLIQSQPAPSVQQQYQPHYTQHHSAHPTYMNHNPRAPKSAYISQPQSGPPPSLPSSSSYITSPSELSDPSSPPPGATIYHLDTNEPNQPPNNYPLYQNPSLSAAYQTAAASATAPVVQFFRPHTGIQLIDGPVDMSLNTNEYIPVQGESAYKVRRA